MSLGTNQQHTDEHTLQGLPEWSKAGCGDISVAIDVAAYKAICDFI